MRSLDFHTHQAITRQLSSKLYCQKRPRREVGHPRGNEDTPCTSNVSGEHMGTLDFHSYLLITRSPFPLLQGGDRRGLVEPFFSPLFNNNNLPLYDSPNPAVSGGHEVMRHPTLSQPGWCQPEVLAPSISEETPSPPG